MKTLVTQKYLVFALVAITVMVPELAHASSASRSVSELLTNRYFAGAIDLGLLILAGFKWFDYLADFKPDGAFKAALIPAVITFAAFQWQDALRWVGIL